MVHRYGHDVVLRMDNMYYHLYVEKFDRHEKILLLDFVTSYEFASFLRHHDYGNYVNRIGSMLLMQLPASVELSVKEGAVYKVPSEQFLNIHWTMDNAAFDDEIPPAIGFSVNMQGENDRQILQFQGEAVFNLRDLFWREVPAKRFCHRIWSKGNESEGYPLNHLRGDLELVVKNVGQGNWNEIRMNGHCHVTFDLGTDMYASVNDCKKLLENTYWGEPNCFQADKPCLIISHWDIDHYNLLTVVDDIALERLSAVYVPESCITLTAKNVADRLMHCCPNLFVVYAKKDHLIKRQVSLRVLAQGHYFILFCGESAASLNLSGLALVVWGSSGAAFLSADHSYGQVFTNMVDAFSNAVNGSMLPMHLVVPHHGGKAGTIPPLTQPVIYGRAIVSVGKNQWGHPISYVRNTLTKRFTWERTDYVGGDISVQL